jgi:hypothetical protein
MVLAGAVKFVILSPACLAAAKVDLGDLCSFGKEFAKFGEAITAAEAKVFAAEVKANQVLYVPAGHVVAMRSTSGCEVHGAVSGVRCNLVCKFGDVQNVLVRLSECAKGTTVEAALGKCISALKAEMDKIST